MLGAVAAPAIFGSAKAAGDTRVGTPLYDFAAVAMGHAFERFNVVSVAAGALLLLAGLGYGSLAGLCQTRLRVRALLTGICWAITLWLTYGLFPQMMQVRASGDMTAFDGLHKLYSNVSHAQVLVLLTVAALTGWMHLDLAPHAPREPAVPLAEPAAVRG